MPNINVTLGDAGIRPVGEPSQATIGIAGTAPNAKTDGIFSKGGAIQYNKPFYLGGRQDAPGADLLGVETDGSVKTPSGTLYEVLNGIYAQGIVAVQMVIVEEGAAEANAFGATHYKAAPAAATDWAIISGKLNIGATYGSLSQPVKDSINALGPGDTIEFVSGNETYTLLVTASPSSGSTNNQIPVEYIGDAPASIADGALTLTITKDTFTRRNLLGSEADETGIYALLAADPKPKILCVGTDLANRIAGGNADKVSAGLVSLAEKLDGVAVLDGPNTTTADAIIAAGLYGSNAAYMIDPGINTADGNVLASPSVAGAIAVNDALNGFWTSPSGQVLEGVLGLQRAVSHGFTGSQAELLNNAGLATILQRGGFILSGNKNVGTDISYQFISIYRTTMAIKQAMQESMLWALNRNITARYFEVVTQSVQAYLDTLTAQGAITGGECYADPSLNTAASIKAGKVYINLDFSGSYPVDILNITITLTDKYIDQLLASVL